MALRDQPYLPLYVNDLLADEKLKRCSASAHGVYFLLLCILHKSDEYGCYSLLERERRTEKQISNFAFSLSRQMPFEADEIEGALGELVACKVVCIDGDTLYQKRMVKDASISEIRAFAGSQGGRPKKQTKSKTSENSKSKTKANSEIEVEVESENATEAEIEDVSSGSESYSVKSEDITAVIDSWNSLGLSRVAKIVPGTERYKLLRARLREYGVGQVLEAISNVRGSPFLNGQNKRGWAIDFDWFIRPNNFPKVLGGNYADREGRKASGNPFLDLLSGDNFDEDGRLK